MTLLTVKQVAEKLGYSHAYTHALLKSVPSLVTKFGASTAVDSKNVAEIKKIHDARLAKSSEERDKRLKLRAPQMAKGIEERKAAAKIQAEKALEEPVVCTSTATHALAVSESTLWEKYLSPCRLRSVKIDTFRFISQKDLQREVGKKFPPPPQSAVPNINRIISNSNIAQPVSFPKEVSTLALQLLAVTGKVCSLSGTDQVADTLKALTKVGEEYLALKNQNDQLRKQLSEKPATNEELVKLCTAQAQDVANAKNDLLFHKQLTHAALDLIVESDKNQSQAMIRERLALRRVLEWMGEVKKRA